MSSPGSAELHRFYFLSESSNLKLGMSAFPMMIRTTPTKMKKNVDAIRLADIGLSLPTLSSRRYSRTPEVKARIKLITEKNRESF